MESGSIIRQQEDLDPENLTMRQSVVDREKLKVGLKGLVIILISLVVYNAHKS